MKMRYSGKGFTYVELVIVLSILTIMTALTVPVVSKEITKQKTKNQTRDINLVGEAVEVFFDDNLAFPAGMADLLTNSGSYSQWAGPYYDTGPGAALFGGDPSPDDDAWGNQYVFTTLSTSALRVASRGADQQAGTTDDIVITVDVTFIRRRTTVEELEAINEAVLAYNEVHLPGTSLPTNWSSALSILISKGYLQPEGGAYATDGWGNAYEPFPAGTTPVVRIRSTMFP